MGGRLEWPGRGGKKQMEKRLECPVECEFSSRSDIGPTKVFFFFFFPHLGKVTLNTHVLPLGF